MNLDLIPYAKINSRITVDLNMKGKTITPEESLGEYINYLGVGKDFLNTIQKALIIHGGGALIN